jgi:hypothetical protein
MSQFQKFTPNIHEKYETTFEGFFVKLSTRYGSYVATFNLG